MIIPVILAGGCGTRLWPLSRQQYPKQFLALTNEYSMLQNTLLRLDGIEDIAPPIVVCHQDHRFILAEQLQFIGVQAQAIILEPARRNTASATAVSAFQAMKLDKDPLLLILPADHIVTDVVEFQQAVTKGRQFAEAGKLLTFGIKPDHAATGYGYIKVGQPLNDAFQVDKFVEKPALAVAEDYIASGDYYWNSGMFMFKASVILAELKRLAPKITDTADVALKYAKHDMDFLRLDEKSFSASSDNSLDYAVMEKTDKAVVLPFDVGWSDVGSWSSLCEAAVKDEHGNVLRGDVITTGVSNCYINASDRLVAAVGLENFVIAETSDAVLVANKNSSQQVKQLVNELAKYDRNEVKLHVETFHPWGSDKILEKDSCYVIRRLSIKPHANLSLHLHHKRNEHWIVIAGTATILLSSKKHHLSKNMSIYVPAGVKHCLMNHTEEPLEVVEIQAGESIVEDDVARFGDNESFDSTAKSPQVTE